MAPGAKFKERHLSAADRNEGPTYDEDARKDELSNSDVEPGARQARDFAQLLACAPLRLNSHTDLNRLIIGDA